MIMYIALECQGVSTLFLYSLRIGARIWESIEDKHPLKAIMPNPCKAYVLDLKVVPVVRIHNFSRNVPSSSPCAQSILATRTPRQMILKVQEPYDATYSTSAISSQLRHDVLNILLLRWLLIGGLEAWLHLTVGEEL